MHTTTNAQMGLLDSLMIATPTNCWPNDLVTEAARLSIARDGEPVRIQCGGRLHVELRFSEQKTTTLPKPKAGAEGETHG